MRFLQLTSAALAAALLVACGGSDDDPPARGTVLSGLQLGQSTRAQIDAGTAASGAQALTGAARCDVVVRYVQYSTRTPSGEAARASAGVFVPTGTDPACTGQRPVLLYGHGTSTSKAKNMALASTDGEASLLVAMYAAQGFIVVAPNYLGYDGSLDWHPYLNATASAVDMIDALRAAKSHLASVGGTTASPQLLISGYSQGGHVAMATHREIQANYAGELTVTASGPMSGPYNMVGFSDVVNGPGPINAGALTFAPMLLTSYQRSYGNIYSAASQVYQPPYDTTAPNIYPNDATTAQLMTQGKLPNDPTQTLLFGAGGLLTDAFKAGYATSAFRTALQNNTLLGWTPARPVAMCGGAQDPTVYYAVNTSAAQADFASRNVPVPAFDLENRATLPAGALGDALFGGFQQSKAAAGASVQAQYHGTLVPPFCSAVIRGFFQQVLAAP
ncbi:Peptidase_S9 domain-containing protein [Rubrivivax sp. A210]|uniref:alpha/beta hydrolase family protein n=1 Tax=Rubrivivax sp. A210 TaxID=2772301 RepID=UPI001919EAFC|nr:lipase family protein [Rubrivivax sp. A210]CAD5371775.1 Peptidase_S9 domain-containing protein [Rubrivivax sp. A210]